MITTKARCPGLSCSYLLSALMTILCLSGGINTNPIMNKQRIHYI